MITLLNGRSHNSTRFFCFFFFCYPSMTYLRFAFIDGGTRKNRERIPPNDDGNETFMYIIINFDKSYYGRDYIYCTSQNVWIADRVADNIIILSVGTCTTRHIILYRSEFAVGPRISIHLFHSTITAFTLEISYYPWATPTCNVFQPLVLKTV